MILSHKKYELFGKLVFEKLVIKPPFQKSNIMPNEACFYYVIKGVSETISEVDRLRIPTRESVLLKCGNYITKILSSQSSQSFQTIAIHFHPEILRKIYENDLPLFLKRPEKRSTTAMTKIKGPLLISKYIESLLFYFENPELVNDDLLVLKLKEIILLLSQTEEQKNINQILSGLFSPTTYSFKQIIDAHLYSDISIEDLSQLVNVSLSSFKREFRRIYNDSPANYLRNKKLEKAAELLRVSDQRITDVAYNSGFTELPHFSKCFKEKFAISPSAYRLTQKGKFLN
ncbi:MAG: AraC family transcriptional regulator [Sediminibacterium sp.]|nr:AraC family transcriptional regulator [Sediminibacterium sp.]